MSRNVRVLFTRYTMTSAHLSIIPEFLEKIGLLGYENTFSVNKAEVINLGNKSDILFRGIKTSAGNQTASPKVITRYKLLGYLMKLKNLLMRISLIQ